MTRNNANGDTIPAYSFAVGISSGVGERWIRLWGGDLPCDVEVRLGRIGAGQFVCTGIRVGANGAEDEYEVTARMLRDIRLGNVLRFIREAYSPSLYGPEVSPAFDIRITPLEGITLGQAMGRSAAPIRVRRGRKGLDPETLRQTAEVYLQVIEEGAAQPLAETAVRVYCHPSTVWRRLQSAWKRFPELKPKEEDKRRPARGTTNTPANKRKEAE